ncbi:MAG: winged helix-turn-helix transcriptional regulator [Thermoplasmatales archaeon]|nr:winged helix-turn-helix transcriptional regulator [Thermoplasmatales archaeon]
MKEDHLALETRKKIYELIASSPGLHKREISRKLNLSLSTVDYHLHYMERKNLVVAKEDRRYRRYFVTEKTSPQDSRIISLLRQETPRKILIFLLENPNAIHRDICESTGKAPSTVSFHIKKLVEADILEEISLGKEKGYNIKNKDRVIDVLITYRSTFLDRAVDKFLDAWTSFGRI